jgi:hypothetical protein
MVLNLIQLLLGMLCPRLVLKSFQAVMVHVTTAGYLLIFFSCRTLMIIFCRQQFLHYNTIQELNDLTKEVTVRLGAHFKPREQYHAPPCSYVLLTFM